MKAVQNLLDLLFIMHESLETGPSLEMIEWNPAPGKPASGTWLSSEYKR